MTISIGGRPYFDSDQIRDRIRRWWHGRRAWDRHLRALAAEVDSRTWPAFPEPDPEPDPAWTIEAIMRSRQPHLYAPDRIYWRDAWADMALFMAAWRADSANLRAECGLPV